MDTTNYTHIRNTILNVSDILDPVFSILLSGRDICVIANTTDGNIAVELAPYQWQQAATTTLVIDNVAGANNIDLVATLDTDPFNKAWALQDSLELTTVGASVILKLIRSGSGTATISVDGVPIMTATDNVGYVLVQATNVDYKQETNLIEQAGGSGGGGSYVTLDTNQTITGIKTFAGAPVISTITNTGTLTLPTTTDTLIGRITTDTLQNKSLVANNCSFIDSTDNTKRLIFTVSGNNAGVTTNLITNSTANRNITLPNNDGTLALTSDLFNYVDLTTNQTIGGIKTFTSKVAITALTNQIDLGASSNIITINSIAPTASRIYTIRDAGGNADFILSTFGSTQTIAGGLTSSGLLTASNGLTHTTGALNLTSTSGALSLTGTSFTTDNPLNITATSNQLALGSSPNITTLTTSGTGNKTITFPTTGGTLALSSDLSNYVDLTTNQTIGGNKTFTSKVAITPLTNQIDLGASPNIITINATVPSSARTYTIPDVGSSTASFIMSTSGSTQTIAGGLTSSGLLTASNGLTLTTGALNLTSTSGAISLTNTAFTTNNALNITPTTNQLVLGTTTTTTISSIAPTASRIYTIRDAGGNADFILSTFGSTQTIAGGLTSSGLLTASNGLTLTTGALNLTSTSGSISLTNTSLTTDNPLNITATSNQLALGASPNITTLSTSGTGNKTITFPAAGGTLALSSDLSNYVDLTTNQTIGGNKTFTSKVAITALTNQIDLGASPNIITINATVPSSARTYTIPDVGSSTASFIMSTSGSTQTIAGGLTSSGLLTASNGLTLTTGALNLTSTSGSVSLTNTTFDTNNKISITAVSSQIDLGASPNITTITSPAPSGSRTYTIPDVGSSTASFIMSTSGSTQTIAGGLTSSGLLTASNGLTLTTGALNLTSTSGTVSLGGTTSLTASNKVSITATSNQIDLGSSPNITTITSPAPSGSRTYTIPDVGSSTASFIMSTSGSTQTIAGGLTSSGLLTASNGLTQTTGALNLTSTSGALSLTNTTFTTNNALNITATSNQLALGTSPNITTLTTSGTGNKTITFPATGGTLALSSDLSNYVDLTTNQTIGGIKTFTSKVAITALTNQIDLGTSSNIITINAIAPTASRTYSIPDVGGNANFILSTSGSGQTISGGLTSSGLLNLTGVGTTTTGNFYNNPSVVNNPVASSYYWSYFASPPAFTGSSVTIPNAYTIYIAGAPNAGTSTITNPYAFYVASGKTYIGGSLQIPTGAVNNYVLTSDASGNASWSAAGSVVSFPDGTLALPGIYFTNEPGTGFYRPGNGQIGVELSGNNYATFTTTGFTSTQPITITPTANQLILGTGTTTTLTATATTSNKTLTLPDATDTLVGLTTSDTLQNKRLIANNCSFRDSTDNTKQLNFTLSGNSSGVITTIASTLMANRTYTIRDAGGNADFILSTFGSTQTIAGGLTSSGLLTASNGLTLTTGALNLTSTSGTVSLGGTTSLTASNKVSITALTNQIDLGASPNITTITSPAPSGSRTYTIPDVGSSTASFIMSTSGSTQTIAGGLTSSGLLTASNGLTLTTGALNLTSTSGTVSLGGTTSLTASNKVSITALTNQIDLGASPNITTITSPAPSGSRTYTIPDVGSSTASFIMSTFGSTQTIAGGLTSSGLLTASNGLTQTTGALNLTSTSGALSLTNTTFTTNNALNITATSNQLALGTSPNITTLTTSGTGNKTITFPATGGTLALSSDLSNYVDLTTNQTVAGNKSFTGRTSVSGLVHTVNSALTGNTVLTSTGYTSVIPLNSTSSFTVTLPSTSGNDGLNFRFINVNSGAVTIQTSTSSECFDGNVSITSLSLLQFDRVNILCYNGFWFTF